MNCIFTIANERLLIVYAENNNKEINFRVCVSKLGSLLIPICAVCVCVFGLEVFEITLKKKNPHDLFFFCFYYLPPVRACCSLISIVYRLCLETFFFSP